MTQYLALTEDGDLERYLASADHLDPLPDDWDAPVAADYRIIDGSEAWAS